MKTIHHVATLLYYDGAQIFEAKAEDGGSYVAVMVEPVGEVDQYLVARVAPERLHQFRSGTADLRSLLLEGEETGWYLTRAEAGLAVPLNLESQSESLVTSGLLPDDGLVLTAQPGPGESERWPAAGQDRGHVATVGEDEPEEKR